MSVPTPSLSPNPWLRVLDALEKKINRHSYDTWLKPTKYSHSSGPVLFVRVPTAEFRHVGDKYADLIQEALDNLGGEFQEVKFVTPEDDPASTPVRHDGGLSARTPAPTPGSQARFDWDGAAQLNQRYTFDAFVIASDRPPKELAEIEDRLRSRFEWGLIADIQPPDLETKVAILQKKAEQEKVILPTDVALYIASNIRSNVRELEGALIRLVAHSSLIGAEITLPYAQQVLKNFIDSQARKVTIESIQKAAAEQFGLRLVEIKAKNNSRAIVYPRQIAMYLAKHLTEASLPEIGRQFGGKHHTTVLHSVEKIDKARKDDKDLNRLLNKLTEQLGG